MNFAFSSFTQFLHCFPHFDMHFSFDMPEERLNEPAENEKGENNLKMHGQR